VCVNVNGFTFINEKKQLQSYLPQIAVMKLFF